MATQPRACSSALVDVFYRPIERVYMAMLRWSMRHRWVIVLACAGGARLAACPLGKAVHEGLRPRRRSGRSSRSTCARPRARASQSTALIGRAHGARDPRAHPGRELHTLMTIGDTDQRTPNKASIYVRLIDPEERAQTSIELMASVRNEIVATPAQGPAHRRLARSTPSTAASPPRRCSTASTGPDLDKLRRVRRQASCDELKKVPGAVDVDTNLVVGKPELQVSIDREKAADLGVQVADVAQTLQLLVGGLKVSTYAENGEDYDVRARAERPTARGDGRACRW